MDRLDVAQLRAALPSESRGDAQRMTPPPDLADLAWEDWEVLGWRDPKAPRRGIDARVVAVDVGRDGLLGVPPDVRRVGWWRGGAPAGAAAGTVVLVGHVDSAQQGAGAFFPLRALTTGDRVVVTGNEGERAVCVVAAGRQYAKASLPRTEVFDQGAAPRLVLLTCGGSFDEATRHYRGNVVVYATPAGG